MQNVKVATLYLNKDGKKLFNAFLKEVAPEAQVTHYGTFSRFENSIEKGTILFYGYHSTPEELEEDLEKIHSLNVFLPINIIFYKQNYQALAKAFHYNINHILNKKFETEDIRRALLKCELKGLSEDKRSLRALQYLLETPIKVKDDLQMYHYLKNYFKQISAINHFLMLKKNEEGFEYLFGSEKLESEELNKEITKLKIPEKAIGEVFYLKKFDVNVFPIYIEEGDVILGVIEQTQDTQLVFSELFLKFLQNVHLYRKVKEKATEMTELANTDEVTGLFNQRKLAADLEEAIKEHEEENKEFSVMFIDVDHFKKVNDLYGHIVGSQMLIDIGKVLRQLLRDTDTIYRYGGDEFVVIMADVKRAIVHKVALRILNSVKNMEFNIENGDVYKLSISIGIAEYPQNATTAKELIGFADEMMYESKKSGRGKVFHLEEVADACSRS